MADTDLMGQPALHKRAWRTPQLVALGNLRDFVRAVPSKAVGKSGPDADGGSDPGAEEMFSMS